MFWAAIPANKIWYFQLIPTLRRFYILTGVDTYFRQLIGEWLNDLRVKKLNKWFKKWLIKLFVFKFIKTLRNLNNTECMPLFRVAYFVWTMTTRHGKSPVILSNEKNWHFQRGITNPEMASLVANYASDSNSENEEEQSPTWV